MSIARDFTFALDSAKADLANIGRDLVTVEANAYWPGTPIDGNGGASALPEEERAKAAPKYDLGIGDYPSRCALHASGPKLAQADRIFATALWHAGTTLQPKLMPCDESSSAAFLRATVITVTWRTEQLRKVPANLVDRGVRDFVETGADVLKATSKGLLAALVRGRIEPPRRPPRPLCRICGLRERGLRAGGRCSTCALWAYRHGGKERPRSMDDDVRVVPHEAKARRVARGEDI